MIRLYMTPAPDKLNESGIKRVVEAYRKYLPEYDFVFIDNDVKADLITSHAASYPEPNILHCHGLYFTADYPDTMRWEWETNSVIISAIRHAQAVTVPSAWVAETFQRDMRFTPDIVPHGINWQEWAHDEPCMGYVLWNKNRQVDVCDNSVLARLVDRFKDIGFVSTFAPRDLKFGSLNWPDNLRILENGAAPHSEMKRIIQRCAVYLSTTKETWGIGILEAMAAGVPVLGYAHGGNTLLVKHGVNGYLARPGDVDDLCNGLKYCLDYRQVLGGNGQELAKEWGWKKPIELIAGIYRRVLEPEPKTIGVVITVYNKRPEQIERAINSALNQTLKPDKIIVVNDGSGDEDTINFLSNYSHPDVTIISQNNAGVAIARNAGIRACETKYIANLDGDDWMEPELLRMCYNALEADRSLGIAYTGLQWHTDDGRTGAGGFDERGRGSPWPPDFDYDRQISYYHRLNHVPSCCVFRREAWKRIGGYQQRYAPEGAGSEDAAFWSMFGAIGFNARKVTDKLLFNYSSGGSTSTGNYREMDWLRFYPWARDERHPFASWATPKNISHPVKQYDEPKISIIIPVGPGHEQDVFNAIDSIEMQFFREWEIVLVNDSGRDIDLTAWPFVRVVKTSGGKGAGYARNRGVEAARGSLIFFLDADDVLTEPEALDKFYSAWNKSGQIVFSHYVVRASWGTEAEAREKLTEKYGNDNRFRAYLPKTNQSVIAYGGPDYNCELAIRQPELYADPFGTEGYYTWCMVSVLMPKKWYNDAGGMDEKLKTWEDVDLMWRLARAGYCFYRIEDELIFYNADSGNRREAAIPKDTATLQEHKNLIQYIRRKYSKDGNEPVCAPCSSSKKTNSIAPSGGSATVAAADMVMIEFWPVGKGRGDNYGAHFVSPTGIKGPDGRVVEYGGYTRRAGDEFFVYAADQRAMPDVFVVKKEEVDVPQAPTPAPEPAPLVEEFLAEPEPIVEIQEDFDFAFLDAPDGVIKALNKLAASREEALALKTGDLLRVRGISKTGKVKAADIMRQIQSL